MRRTIQVVGHQGLKYVVIVCGNKACLERRQHVFTIAVVDATPPVCSKSERNGKSELRDDKSERCDKSETLPLEFKHPGTSFIILDHDITART